MRWLVFVVLFIPFWANATSDQYTFGTNEERARYTALIEELRCPKCQNQTLDDSNSEIALDLRNEVFRLMDEGKSDEEVVDYLVARYGEFVRYKPPVNSQTVFLWAAPIVMLIIGVFAIVIVLRSSRATTSDADVPLSADEQERLRKIKEGN